MQQVSLAIMSHPDRTTLARQLAADCSDLAPRIVVDPEPKGPRSALRTAARAWAAAELGSTHHVVLQDDIALHERFASILQDAIAIRPTTPLVLFSGWNCRNGQVARVAALAGRSFAPLVEDWVTAVAIALPTSVALGLGEFLEQHRDDPSGSDSDFIYTFLRKIDLQPLTLVPNLVQHDIVRTASLWQSNITRGPIRSACFPVNVELSDEAFQDEPIPVPGAVANLSFAAPYSNTSILGSTPDQHRDVRTSSWLEQLGHDPAGIIEQFRHDFGDARSEALRRWLAEPTCYEAWLTALQLGSQLEPSWNAALLDGPFAKTALSTLIPGAVRRILPEPALRELASESLPLLAAGVRRGHAFLSGEPQRQRMRVAQAEADQRA